MVVMRIMEIKFKKATSLIAYCLLGAVTLTCLCGCNQKENFVNTHKMPGHKVLDLLNSARTQGKSKKEDQGPITRTKSGVYIYKDESIVNTTGYRFQIKDKTNLGPKDVRFDAEHFKTRY